MANSTTIYRSNSNHNSVVVTENKTLAAADCGITQAVSTDAITITLPSTAVGLRYRIENHGSANGSCAVTISPAAADKIVGAALTAADNKDIINTKATAKADIDFIELVADGTDGWYVHDYAGTWSREA